MIIAGHRSLAAIGIAALLAGCASTPKPEPMTCAIETSAQVNPTEGKRPSPVLLRVYGLKSAAAFGSADFVAIYQRDQTELAADITVKDEYLMAPGETRSCSKMLPPETRFIGVIAAFRDLEHATWRSVTPVEGGKKNKVTVRVAPLAVDVSTSR